MLHFYCEVLGCTIERRREALGLIQLRAGRGLIDLVPVAGKLGRAGGAAPGPEGRKVWVHPCSLRTPRATSWNSRGRRLAEPRCHDLAGIDV